MLAKGCVETRRAVPNRAVGAAPVSRGMFVPLSHTFPQCLGTSNANNLFLTTGSHFHHSAIRGVLTTSDVGNVIHGQGVPGDKAFSRVTKRYFGGGGGFVGSFSGGGGGGDR